MKKVLFLCSPGSKLDRHDSFRNVFAYEAETVRDARLCVYAHSDLDLIVIDPFLSRQGSIDREVIRFIRDVRQRCKDRQPYLIGYFGPMTDQEDHQTLLQAGCDETCVLAELPIRIARLKFE